MKNGVLDVWTDILHLVVEQTVPERKTEIEALWKQYQPPLHEVDNNEGITLQADVHGIRFARKDLQLLWLLGFSAWKSVALYSPAIIMATALNDTVLNVLKDDVNASELERDYFERLRTAEKLVGDRNLEMDQWPPDVPLPVIERSEMADDEGRMMFDVINYATAGLFLHELRHVMFRQDKDGPKPYSEEELRCDVFARDMMTAKLAAYSEATKVDYAKVLSKRSFGLALMALYLHVATPAWGRGGTPDYPPLGHRLDALVETAALDENDHFWMFVACVLFAEARRAHINLTGIGTGLSFASLARELLALLNPPETFDL